MHRLINILYSGFMVGIGIETVFQLAFSAPSSACAATTTGRVCSGGGSSSRS